MAKGTVNKVILLGRLGANAEMRVTQSGVKVAKLSIATSEMQKDGGISTEWHRVTVFGKGAENIQKYTAKGSTIYIEGRLQTNKYQDKNGNTQYSTDIIASNFQFIGGMKNSPNNNNGNNMNNNMQQPSDNPIQQNQNMNMGYDDMGYDDGNPPF